MRILLTTFYDPNYLGVRLLGAIARKSGHSVGILQLKDYRHVPIAPSDATVHTGYRIFAWRYFRTGGDTVFPITRQEQALFSDAIASWKPDIIGFSLRSPYMHLLPLLLPIMRHAAPKALLVGGGFGPTYDPVFTLRHGADVVVRGEGEGALLNLADRCTYGHDWHDVRNCTFLREGQLVQNPLRPLLQNLDAQPFPLYYDADFISIEDERCEQRDMRLRTQNDTIYGAPYITLTGRGCIANCSYCAAGHWRDQYNREGLPAPRLRQRSIENILAECAMAKAHGEQQITLNDEYFIRSTSELLEFFRRYRKEIDLPFFAHLHHGQLLRSPELLRAVKEVMGDGFIPLGVQSGSEAFARRIYNRKNNNRDYLDFIKLCAANGLSGNFHIIGGNALEGEAEEDALYDFCAQVPFDPSLKVDWQVYGPMLRLLEGSPLAREHPELGTTAYPVKKYSRIMILAELRNKVDAKTFADIRADSLFADNPEHLLTLLHTVVRDRHIQYLAREIERLHGREVYFWGCGEMYRYKRHLFQDVRPRCILVDRGEPPAEVDGIPVRHPDGVLDGKDILPVVIFSQSPFVIYHKLQIRYPQYADVVTCAML